MKKNILAFILSLVSLFCYSQNVGIGNNNPLSKLHVSGAIRSDTLIGIGPRYLFAAANGRIYDSIVNPIADSWLINGNSNIGATNFLGTTNANDLIFKTNNIERMRLFNNGIFSNTPINIIGSDGQGWNSSPNGNSIAWTLENPGYTGLFYNSSTVANADGLMIKIAGTATTNVAFDVSSGVQGTAGIPILTSLGNGNTGVYTNTPNERLHVNGNIQLGNPLASTNALGDKFYLSNTFNNTDDFWMARFNKLADESEWRLNISDDAISTPTIDRIVFGRTTFPAAVWQPLVDILNDGRVGIGNSNPRGKFDVMNGDAYVADNIYPQNSFNVGRSANSIYSDNIRPYTDNGFRVYDGNSNSHLRLEAVGQCQIQAYTTTGSIPNLLETAGTEGILSLNPTGGGVRVGIPNGLSTTINPALPDNPLHKMTVGYGYFVAGNYNSDPAGGQGPGTTWIGGVGGLAIGMNRNAGKSHVDLWNTTDVTQAAATNNIDRGFEFRGYDNAYAERTMARIDGIGQFFSNGTFAISDKRFKTNITPFNEKVLSKLMEVKTYNYQMHQPVSRDGGELVKGSITKENDFGVLVQELYELFPSVVYKPKDESKEPWAVDYSRLSLYLLQGMKEQQEIINEHKTEIKNLNDKYTELLNRLSKLENK